MRPQWQNGQTHHHHRGWNSRCHCCRMFGPSRYREGRDTIIVSKGADRTRQRSEEKDYQKDRTIYDRINMKLQYGDQNTCCL